MPVLGPFAELEAAEKAALRSAKCIDRERVRITGNAAWYGLGNVSGVASRIPDPVPLSDAEVDVCLRRTDTAAVARQRGVALTSGDHFVTLRVDHIVGLHYSKFLII